MNEKIMQKLVAFQCAYDANKAAHAKTDSKVASNILMSLMLLAVVILPTFAMAAPWDGVANKVLDILNGGLVRSIAIIGVIACGLAGLFGKLSWDWASKIIIGICLIFGAAAIVDAISSAAK